MTMYFIIYHQSIKHPSRRYILNDHMIDVLVTGTVAFKDFLTLADDGKFQKLTLSATPTATELMQIVGRVMASRTGAGQTKAHIWVRK